MVRPIPTDLYHFTHVKHLRSIIDEGLHCNQRATSDGLLEFEVGNTDIKAQRARRVVPIAPAGVVDEYVPFYFAPRSPMMSAISHGRVAQYAEGTDPLIYLCTTVEALADRGLEILLTDRNAALKVTAFVHWQDGEPDDDFIDWPLMKSHMWANDAEHPDRRERRMAECLVHGSVPWQAFSLIGAKNEDVAEMVRSELDGIAQPPNVAVRRDWYI